MSKQAERPRASPALSHSDLQPGVVHASESCWANRAHRVDKGLAKQISEALAFGNSMDWWFEISHQNSSHSRTTPTTESPLDQVSHASVWRASRFEIQPHPDYQVTNPGKEPHPPTRRVSFLIHIKAQCGLVATVLEPTQKLPEQQGLSLQATTYSFLLPAHTQVSHKPL